MSKTRGDRFSFFKTKFREHYQAHMQPGHRQHMGYPGASESLGSLLRKVLPDPKDQCLGRGACSFSSTSKRSARASLSLIQGLSWQLAGR